MNDFNKSLAAGLMLYDKDDESGRNGFIAQSSAHAERTEEGVWTMPLSEAARDRVLFYGRQDTGHALLNSIDILRHVAAIRRTLRIIASLLGILVVLLATPIALLVYLSIMKPS